MHSFDNGTYVIAPSFATKIQSPKQVEYECIQKSKARPLSNPGGLYSEEVIDAANTEVIGVVLQTNGCEINLADYEQVLELKKKYNVPVKIINMALFREKKGLEKYEKQDYQNFISQLGFWSDFSHIDNIKTSPEQLRTFLNGYYSDVVVGGNYESDIRDKISQTFTKMIEYAYSHQRFENTHTPSKLDIEI